MKGIKNKKFFILILILIFFLIGCATATFKKTEFDQTGKVLSVTEATSKRPIFAATSMAWTNNSGNLNSSSSVDLQQMVGAMLAGYLASQTVPVGTVVK